MIGIFKVSVKYFQLDLIFAQEGRGGQLGEGGELKGGGGREGK
jgi:hypothetical protein